MMNLPRTLTLLLLLTSDCLSQEMDEPVAVYERLLRRASKVHHYERIPNSERQRARALFSRTIKEGYSEELALSWTTLSMDLRQQTAGNEMLTILQEQKGSERGRGWFLFRQKAGSSNALQCPHSFTDLGSRTIGLAWMLDGNFRASAFNTVPRKFTTNGQEESADMGKEVETYFMAFTLAWARSQPKSAILQVHGYSNEKRLSDSASQFQAILSSCTKEPSRDVRRLAANLTKQLDLPVAVYPHDIRELGGTLNVQAIGLRYEGFKRFIHLELCREERDRLKTDPTYRARWISILEHSLEDRQ